jgi:outer membrane immunogenic protein
MKAELMPANGYFQLLAAAVLAAMSGSNVASASDLGLPTKALPSPPPFSWTGFYVGVNAGGDWPQHTVTDTFYGLIFDTGTTNGEFIGGGQLGYNWQAGSFVGGVEGELDGVLNFDDSAEVLVPAVGHSTAVTSNNRWIATVAGRLGVVRSNWLFYGKVGGGWVGNDGFAVGDLIEKSIRIGSNTRSGWLLGGGIEWGFADNWTVKVEYDYLGLGRKSFTIPVGAPLSPLLIGDTFTGKSNVQEFKVGLNYVFNKAMAAKMPSPDSEDTVKHVSTYNGTDLTTNGSYTAFMGATMAPVGSLDDSGFRIALFTAAGRYQYPTADSGQIDT